MPNSFTFYPTTKGPQQLHMTSPLDLLNTTSYGVLSLP